MLLEPGLHPGHHAPNARPNRGWLRPRNAIRILFVTDSIREPLTGVGRVAVTLMRDLCDLGAELVGVDHQANPLAESICGSVAVLPCHGGILQMGRWHLTLLRRIADLGIAHDVLFDPTGYPNAWGHHPHQAVLVHDLSMFEPGLYRRGKRSWFQWFYRRALAKAQLCVCVSEHTRGQLVARFDLPAERCVVVPNSIDPSFAEPPTGAAHPQMPETPFLLVVGTIERRKNLRRVLEAFGATDLAQRLVLAGRPGNGSEELITQATALGDRVLILRDVGDQQLRHLYRAADGLVFASSEEGFGLPILEAMQSDTPVLTSNVSAMPEVAGDAALLVDPTDTAAIGAAMTRLVTDQELRRRLIERGRMRLPVFDSSRNARLLLRHLEQVARQ